MKCDWEALSNNTLHGTYWPDLFWTSTMAVASRMWFQDLPLNKQYVLTSAVGLPFASAGVLLFADSLSFVNWFGLSICSKVWCLLWHWRNTCFEHLWFLVSGCKQSKQSPDCLAWLRHCLACILRICHIWKVYVIHYTNCVATLE